MAIYKACKLAILLSKVVFKSRGQITTWHGLVTLCCRQDMATCPQLCHVISLLTRTQSSAHCFAKIPSFIYSFKTKVLFWRTQKRKAILLNVSLAL